MIGFIILVVFIGLVVMVKSRNPQVNALQAGGRVIGGSILALLGLGLAIVFWPLTILLMILGVGLALGGAGGTKLDNDLVSPSEYVAEKRRIRDSDGLDWWVYKDRQGSWWVSGSTAKRRDRSPLGPFANPVVAEGFMNGRHYAADATGRFAIPIN